MNTNIISTPKDIIRVLRQYFTANNITAFERDEASTFSFKTSFAGKGFMIQADADVTVPRVTLLTALLCHAEPTLDECRQVTNELNRRCRFVGAFVCPEEKHFYLESTLALGDGECLRMQLFTLAEGHMSGVAKVGPILGRFSRRESTFERIELELDMHATLCAEVCRQGTPHRASGRNRWTPPVDLN